MRTRALLLPVLSAWAVGCDGTEAPPPDDETPGITVTISTVTAPALVAFRDGLEGAWQAATMTTPATFEAEVHGPYVVTVVCQETARAEIITYQLARTPDDERALMRTCDFPPVVRHAVVGRMVQPGRVQIEDALRASSTADWDFALSARSGTHDLMATTSDRIALRRAIAVTGATAVMPQVDVDQEGALFADVAFTVTNAAPDETLVASVHLDKPSPITPFNVYRGPIAPAKVAPDSVLVPTDKQSVSLQATAGSATRSLRRPFRVGGDTVYTLPPPVGDVRWEIASGNLAVSWSSVPEFGSFSVSTNGSSSDGAKLASHSLDLSPRFVAATGITRATIDTDIAGYKPEWRGDFARPYSRRIFVQLVVDGVISTSSVSEQINAVTALGRPASDPLLANSHLAQP